MKATPEKRWAVKLDKKLCTLCEVCAVRCPTGSLSLVRERGSESLIYKFALCDGCGGLKRCQEFCPEKALTIDLVAPARKGKESEELASGKLAECHRCHTLFAPQKKLMGVKRKATAIHKADLAKCCPPCRREILIQSLPQ